VTKRNFNLWYSGAQEEEFGEVFLEGQLLKKKKKRGNVSTKVIVAAITNKPKISGA
jgi:hypothetical protein